MRKLLISILSVALGAALIYGATMAWFTDEADVAETTFTAGTVDITAAGSFDADTYNIENVNPGDDFSGSWTFINAGTKRIMLRIIPTFNFAPAQDHIEDFDEIDEYEKYGFIASDKFRFSHTSGQWVDTDPDDGWEVENEPTSVTGSIGLVLYYVGNPVDEGSNIIAAGHSVDFAWTLSFHGEQMNNKYQGSKLTVGAVVQAIQASHEDEWDWDEFATYNP